MENAMTRSKALLIGNSDGMGLAMTKRLLAAGWQVTGVSRSKSPVNDPAYHHHVADVGDVGYPDLLAELVRPGAPDLCIYFAGIGEPLDPRDMSMEARTIDVNLTGMVRTAAAVIPKMADRGSGHFMGVSSLADELLSAEAPAYFASKAGFSNYLGGLAPALKPLGVAVTNLRFGFVDTKMAQGDHKPCMISVDQAVDHLEKCMRRKPARYSAPKRMIPLIKLARLLMKPGGG